MLDAGKLATLRAVVEHGSLSGAARALALTQPAVSRQVALLEAQLATPLVRRTRQGVEPTEAGRLLARHAAEIERRLALAEAEVAALSGGPRGRVRLGSFFTAFAQLTPEIEGRAEVELPGLEIENDLVDRATAFARIAAGTLDAAVVYEHPWRPAPAPRGIDVVPAFADPARILLPASHPLAQRRSVRCADLAGERWVRGRSGSAGELLDAVLARAGIAPPLLHAGRGDEPVEGQVYVAAGEAVMLAHELCVIVDRERIAARPLRDAPARAVQLALPSDASPAARALAPLLRGLRIVAAHAR